MRLKTYNLVPDVEGEMPSFSLDEVFTEYEQLEIETGAYSSEIDMAFTKPVRMQIGRRDKWTCQNTGKQFKDGFMVHAAHYNHEYYNHEYNTVGNGRILTVKEHLLEHIELFLNTGSSLSVASLGLIANLAFNNGLMTYKFYEAFPFHKYRDRKVVKEILLENNLNPDFIIHLGEH